MAKSKQTDENAFCVITCAIQLPGNIRLMNEEDEKISFEITKEDDVNFRYVNTTHNPADISTRGTTTADLRMDKFWWNGPEWLKEDPNE